MRGVILAGLLAACGGAVETGADDQALAREAPALADGAGAEPLQALCAHTLYSDWIDETVSPPVAHSDTFDAAYVDGEFFWQGQTTEPRFEIATIGVIELAYHPGDLRVTVNGETIRTGCTTSGAGADRV